MPPDPIIKPLADDAWTHLPPAAAALFIVLILVLVGGIWLATTYMKTYGARRNHKSKEACDQPSTKTGPGPSTLLGLTRTEIDKERARSNRTQDERLARLENQIDKERTRLDKLFEIEGRHRSELLFEIRKIEERVDKLIDMMRKP